MGRVEGPVRVVAPFVGVRGAADDGVLVEGEEGPVGEDGEVVGAYRVDLAFPSAMYYVRYYNVGII